MPMIADTVGKQSPVTVYTTTNCTRCVLTKRFLNRLGVPFREISIFREENAAQELMKQTGTLEAPVTIIGKQFVRGYNPEAIASLLQMEGWKLSED
ncbi:glutaredoxin family protein [Alicyclobacillus sp. SO9]|uniref:glutaredoxin family protein n=1 Tax=Alicyclobacillus sp. SO9 TaxID=2665646 RepID=UPI0018E72B50|nr:glutaredoxin family protein [Alicyclobacillus sp. SO9]QQE80085.1 glutaredoxin family protein [Alicyclobacillus sp. SO9]